MAPGLRNTAAVADARDGSPGRQFGGPEVARDQVVEQRAHVPAVAGGGRVPPIGRDPGYDTAGLVERLCV